MDERKPNGLLDFQAIWKNYSRLSFWRRLAYVSVGLVILMSVALLFAFIMTKADTCQQRTAVKKLNNFIENDSWLYSESIPANRYKEVLKNVNTREHRLAHVIKKSFPVIAKATVELNPGENIPCIKGEKRARALVALTYKGGNTLINNQCRAIARLVSSSRESLDPFEVAVLDPAGIRDLDFSDEKQVTILKNTVVTALGDK